MIWRSLQIGWGNTSAIFALALLPIILISSPAKKSVAQAHSQIESQRLAAADQRTPDLRLAAD